MEKASPVRLSVIVIARNEARHIEACLASVAFADEWIVVDSGSTDDTVARARACGARVAVTTDWPGFGPQKNRALDMATGDWVLSIDADERVTPELAAEIQATLQRYTQNQDTLQRPTRDPDRLQRPTREQDTLSADTHRQTLHDAYEIPRLSSFCGKPIRHSGWWPDHVLRLFRRGTARFTDAAVHERVVAKGSVGRLRAHFTHQAYDNLDALLVKINRYSSDAAAMMHARGKTTSIAGALGHGAWTFVRIYLIRRGFLDGRHGIVLAVAAAAGSFFRYAKLYFLQKST